MTNIYANLSCCTYNTFWSTFCKLPISYFDEYKLYLDTLITKTSLNLSVNPSWLSGMTELRSSMKSVGQLKKCLCDWQRRPIGHCCMTFIHMCGMSRKSCSSWIHLLVGWAPRTGKGSRKNKAFSLRTLKHGCLGEDCVESCRYVVVVGMKRGRIAE